MDSWSKGLELGKSWMKRAALQNQTSLYSVIQIKQQKAKVVDYLKILACFLRVVLTFPMQVFLSSNQTIEKFTVTNLYLH